MGTPFMIRALTVPPETVQGVVGAAPPRVLVVWPGVLTVEAVMTGVEFQYRRFAGDGRALVYVATVNFEEILDTRITSEQLRQAGEGA